MGKVNVMLRSPFPDSQVAADQDIDSSLVSSQRPQDLPGSKFPNHSKGDTVPSTHTHIHTPKEEE